MSIPLELVGQFARGNGVITGSLSQPKPIFPSSAPQARSKESVWKRKSNIKKFGQGASIEVDESETGNAKKA